MTARRWCAGLVRRVGRRGAVLLWLAILDLVYAFSLAAPPPQSRRSATTLFVAGIMPLPIWAMLWAVVGVVLLVGAFMRRDRWAYACAVGLKILWGALFLVGWIVADVPRGWVSAAVFFPMAVVVFVISTWPEPQITEHISRDDDVPFGGRP